MNWDAWRFSAKLAWKDAFIRWVLLGTILIAVGGSGFLLWRLLPDVTRSGVFVIHYNIYLGIDDVRSWPWIFLQPGVTLLIILLNALCSFGLFRGDALAARTLVAVAAVITVIWSVSSFFLISVNL